MLALRGAASAGLRRGRGLAEAASRGGFRWRSSTSSRRRKMAAAAAAMATTAAVGTATVTGLPQAAAAVGPVGRLEEEEEELPLRYDAQRIKAYWDKRPLEVFTRSLEVCRHFVPFLSKLLLWEVLVRGRIREHEGLQRKYGARLREMLTELGPCFVKLGQALSIRPDLLPTPFLQELQKLCDAVPSFPTKTAMEVMRKDLGRDPAETFADFGESTTPVAAASLGQVYKLKLKKGGEVVAVKVQRPDMMRSILRDLHILRNMAIVVEAVKSVVTNQRPFEVALLDTFAEASVLELDYVNEARNQERFRKELMPKMGGRVYVPKVHWEHTTRKVLVTEWVDGEQLARSAPDVIVRLTTVGVECFLVQLLETGFFHADPHPGNLLVTPQGKLALIDFGLCAEVPLPDTKVMTLSLVHLMQGDIRGLISDAVELGFLPSDDPTLVDRLHPALQRVYDSGQLVDASASGSAYRAVSARRKRFLAVSFDLNRIFFEYPFLVPNYFALITRSMVVLEGIAVTGDPAFDIFAAAYPYATRRAVSLFGMSNLSAIAQEAYRAHVRAQQLEEEEEGGESEKKQKVSFFSRLFWR